MDSVLHHVDLVWLTYPCGIGYTMFIILKSFTCKPSDVKVWWFCHLNNAKPPSRSLLLNKIPVDK